MQHPCIPIRGKLFVQHPCIPIRGGGGGGIAAFKFSQCPCIPIRGGLFFFSIIILFTYTLIPVMGCYLYIMYSNTRILYTFPITSSLPRLLTTSATPFLSPLPSFAFVQMTVKGAEVKETGEGHDGTQVQTFTN